MQSGGGAQQAGGGHGRSKAASASASPSSSSSAVSTPQLGFDQQQQQQQQQRQMLQQHLLRRQEGNDAILAYQAGLHGMFGGANFASTNSVQLSQQSGKFIDLGQQHGSPIIREEGQSRGQGFEQQPLNPVHQAYMQYAFQAAQQKSALGMQPQQQMKIGTFSAPGKDQDARIGNMKIQELISMQAANQCTPSSSRKSSERFSLGEQQTENSQQTMSDQRADRKPPNQTNFLGQAVPVMAMQAPQAQHSIQNMANNPIAMAAQMQAMLERNIDLSHPANANLMTQLIPLMQSRMMAQQKSSENNIGGSSSSVPMSKQLQVTSPKVANENYAPANSPGNVSGQSGSSNARPGSSTTSLGVNLGPTPINNSNNISAQQFSVHGREGQLPPRQPTMTGNGMLPMNVSQSSMNLNQGAENSLPLKIAPSGPEFMQMQNARQLNQVSQQPATSSSDMGSGNATASQGGQVAQTQQQPLGFTKQQLHVLKAQILAFRRIKKNEVLPRELLQSIVPPPLEIQMQQALASPGNGDQDRSVRKNVEDHNRRLESNEKGPQISTSVGPPNMSREEAAEEERATTSTVNELGIRATSQEAPAIVSTGKEEQQMTGSGRLDQEVERVIEKTPVRSDPGAERGKAVASTAAVPETAQAKKAVQANSVSQPKDANPTRKYHGPLFDFPVFTRKHDGFGTSMMMNNNGNLMLAYDIKDLLMEEGAAFLKRKREENIKKIGDILAVNLERKRIRPDLVLRLQIEEKKLRLADVQARLRDEIEQQQQEIMAMPDRPYRKFVRLCERQRQDLARQVQASQKAVREKQTKSILQWRKKLLEAHWAIRDARTARNRGVAKYHERMLREFSKRKDDDRSMRMEALKNNDVERYKDLLEKQTKIPGDSSERFAVLSSFLTKTEEYLYNLGSKITATKNQQEVEEAANAAAAAARAQGLSEEEVRAAAACAREEVMIRNRFIEMNAPKASSSANKYYNLAHAVSEDVVRQPSMLRAGRLRDYQLVGLQWMLSLYNNKLNGILADEMGLGKTVQVMALIAYLMEFKGNYGPHLIIVPNAVLVNWKSEFLNWLPSVSCIFYVGSKDQRSRLFSQEVLAMKFNVLVTTYEFIMFDRSKLSRLDWKYIIIDEAQRMKDRESVLARDLDKYRCQRRLLLTGTPLQNDLKELWSLLNLLLPEVFDNRKAFHDWFSQPFQKEGPTHDTDDDWLETEKKVIIIHRLHQILEPFMLRRRVVDVEGSLPPKVSIVLRCRMSAIQSSIYDWIKSTGTLRVDPEDESRRAQKNPIYQPKIYKTLNNRCMELRKTCNHPLLNYPYFSDFSKDFLVRSCGKLFILDRILIKLQRTGHRVLLFSTMTKLLDILEEYLQWRRLVYRRIDGTTSLEDRESAIVEFNSPETDCFIFLLSIRAAGRGLNLQSADTVVIYDPDPNPKNEEQAVARAHRIGQKREVKVIYMEAVVDKISSHQKEDEFRSGGIVESDDDLAGKDRYMGSIESLIRNNIQQYKIDMADEVINAGRFDQRTTHEERRNTLETLLHDEERYQETVHDVPSLQEVNRMIARSKEEVEIFDQMDEEFDWAEEMTRYDQVPLWLRANSEEVNATIANLSKKPSKSLLSAGNYGMDSTDLTAETEKRRGRPKAKKVVYTELDENGELSEASSEERNDYDEEGDIVEFEEDEFSGAIGAPPLNKEHSEEEGPISAEGSDYVRAPESAKTNRVLEEAGSSGSSSDNQRLAQMVSPAVSLQKFGSLSALDARPSSHSKLLPDELEEGEIAVSGDSPVDVQHSGSWINERDDGEDEQVLQPKIKRKRSMRVRPRHNADKPEEKFNESPSLRRGDPQLPFQVDHKQDSQYRNTRLQKALPEPNASKNNDNMGPSVKNKRNLPSKKIPNTAKVHVPVKSGRGTGVAVSERSRDNRETKVSGGTAANNAMKMAEMMQKKCKIVINRLQRKIEKEGQEIIPLLSDLWRRIEKSSSGGRAYDNMVSLRTINGRFEKSLRGVKELVSDVQLMLKNAMQFYGFSHEVKTEAEMVHDLFLEILKLSFPDADLEEARNSISFSAPVSTTARQVPAQSKRHKMTSDVEPDPSSLQKAQSRGLSEDMKSRSHTQKKETRLGSSTNHEHRLQDDPRPFTHPGDLVICKGKRKDREKSAVKPGSASAGPVSPTVSSSIRSPGAVSAAKNAKLSQHMTQQQGRAGNSPQQASSGGSSVGWANPVKRMRTDAGKRRPSHI